MRNFLALSLSLLFGLSGYGQINTAIAGKIYLKNGKTKEGYVFINSDKFRIEPVNIKHGKDYLKKITLKPYKGAREKIAIEEVNEIELTVPEKAGKKGSKTIVYKPVIVKGETILTREVIACKLYEENKETFVITNQDMNLAHGVYYLQKGNSYEQTTLAKLEKDYNCNTGNSGKREERIALCLQGK